MQGSSSVLFVLLELPSLWKDILDWDGPKSSHAQGPFPVGMGAYFERKVSVILSDLDSTSSDFGLNS